MKKKFNEKYLKINEKFIRNKIKEILKIKEKSSKVNKKIQKNIFSYIY